MGSYRGCEGGQLYLRMTQTFFQPRCLLVGMQGGTHHPHAFVPFHVAVWGTAGPLKLIARSCQHLVPPVIGAPYPF